MKSHNFRFVIPSHALSLADSRPVFVSVVFQFALHTSNGLAQFHVGVYIGICAMMLSSLQESRSGAKSAFPK